MLHLSLVAFGGAIGASLRHLVNLVSLRLFGPNFPWGTMLINIVGSFAMGLFVGWLARRAGTSNELRLFVATVERASAVRRHRNIRRLHDLFGILAGFCHPLGAGSDDFGLRLCVCQRHISHSGPVPGIVARKKHRLMLLGRFEKDDLKNGWR